MTEIEYLLDLNYSQCVDFLIKKYGPVPGDYFLDLECTKKNTKITRGKDGLYIHHIDEDKAILLSTPSWAIKNKFEYQKANRLVYCNLLEHLVLHIKIFEHPNDKKNKGEEVGVGGIYNFIIPELNDIYSGIVYEKPWKQKVVENIMHLKNDYFKCIKRLIDKEFPYPILTSFIFNEKAGIWNIKNNERLFEELKQIGVKY